MSQIYHKRGDTLSLNCTWKDGTGAPINLTGYTIASQVRAVNFVDNLVVTVNNAANGEFSLSRVAASTALWPITDSKESRLFCDIQFTSGSLVTSTQTFQIVVVEDITQ